MLPGIKPALDVCAKVNKKGVSISNKNIAILINFFSLLYYNMILN